MTEEDLSAGLAVGVDFMVAQRNVKIIGQGIQPVVGKLRQKLAAHAAGAQIRNQRPPGDAVICKAFGQDPQVKGGVVGQ